MNITIAQRLDIGKRVIDVSVTADAGKRLSRVEATFDNFRLPGDPSINPPVGSYSHSYVQSDAISPGRERVVVVTAWHTDGTTDASQRRWYDILG